MKLTVETNNKSKFNSLLSFLRSNGYKVQVHDNPLNEEDWAMPGRAATDEEHEAHAKAMDSETGGENVDVVFDRMIKKYSK